MTKATDGRPALYDLDEVRRAYTVLFDPGDVCELRAFDARLRGERWGGPTQVSGYTRDGEHLAQMVAQLTEASAVHVTLNPCLSALYSRRADTVARCGKDEATKDPEIARRRWLFIDVDPIRPRGVSSTEFELAAGKKKAQEIAAALRAAGWPDPVVCLSGNGWHLLYRVDLPNDAAALDLVSRCLQALAARYNDAATKIDTINANASRLTKMYGTRACKGSNTEERPHRMSRIVRAPEGGAQVVPRGLLERLAAAAPEATTPATSRSSLREDGTSQASRKLDVAAWLARHVPDATGPEPWQGGSRWTLPVCPFDEGHARGEAWVAQHPSGAVSAGCHHESCKSWGWKELRAKFEPSPEARGLEALAGVRAAVLAIPGDAEDGDVVTALGPVYEALLAVPPGALRDAAVSEVHKALKPRCKSLTLRGLRADVVHRARQRSGADAQPVALARGSDVEIAEHVLDDLERDGEHLVFDRGRLHRYDPATGTWQRLDPAAVRMQVAALDGVLVRSAESDQARPLLVGARRMRDVYTVCLDQRNREGFFDEAPRGLAFANGFLALDEREKRLVLHPLAPEHRATVGYTWDYDPDAQPGRFYSLLEEVWPEDEDRDAKIELLREWVGAALLGLATRYQKAVVLVGAGANGKSTILSIIQHLFPPDSVCAVNPQDMSDEYRRAMIAGKRLNCVSELPEAEIMQSESLKAIVSGDAITAREIREAPFRFKPEAGHLFSANILPSVRDTSKGFWRRWLVLAFNREFAEAEQIKDLDQSILADEAAAIANWALQGAEHLVARGHFLETNEMQAAREDWQRGADPVSAFLNDCCQIIPAEQWNREDKARETGTSGAVLYQEYREWAEREGHARMSSTTFGRRLGLLCRRVRDKAGVVYAIDLLAGSKLRPMRPDPGGF